MSGDKAKGGKDENVVNMVALFNADGSFNKFQDAAPDNDKDDDVFDSASEFFSPAAYNRRGSNAGSAGWVNRTIAQVNRPEPRQAMKDIRLPRNAIDSPKIRETGARGDKFGMELEKRIVQEQCSPLKIYQHVAKSDSGEADDEGTLTDPFSACVSIAQSSINEETTYEYRDCHVAERPLNMKEIEQVIKNKISTSLLDFKEAQDNEVKTVLHDQEKKFKESLSGLENQLRELIDDSCRNLEESFKHALQGKTDLATFDDTIKNSINVAKEEMRSAFKDEIDKVNQRIEETEKVVQQSTKEGNRAIENKVDAISARIGEAEKVIIQTSDHIKAVESKLNKKVEGLSGEVAGKLADAIGNNAEAGEKVKVTEEQLGEMKKTIATFGEKLTNMNKEMEQHAERVLKQTDTRIDAKFERRSGFIIEQFNTQIEKRISELEIDTTLKESVEQLQDCVNKMQSTLPDVISQELDGRMDVLTTDVEDKLSQDVYRIIDGRLQKITNGLPKCISNTVDVKLRGVADARSEEEIRIRNAIWGAVEASVSQLVKRELEHVTRFIKEDVCRVKSDLDHLKLARGEYERERENTPNGQIEEVQAQLKDVNRSLERISHLSKECDNNISRLTKLLAEGEERVNEVNETRRRLKEEAALILDQTKESIYSYTRMIEESRKESEKAIDATIEALAVSIKESKDIINELKSANETHLMHVLPEKPFYYDDASLSHMRGQEHVMGPNAIPPSNLITLPQTYTVKEFYSPKVTTKLVCDGSTPTAPGEMQSPFCSVVPSDCLYGEPGDRIMVTPEAARDSPRRLEVKYVDMNGQLVKVTREHMTYDEMLARSPTASNRCYFSPSSPQHGNVYY